MIRFIDLRHSVQKGDGIRFAFYDTVESRFVSVNGAMAWNSLSDLEGDFLSVKTKTVLLSRLIGVMADWAKPQEVPSCEDEWRAGKQYESDIGILEARVQKIEQWIERKESYESEQREYE
jgi:hypothetical protein